MKVTKNYIKQVIKEEYSRLLIENASYNEQKVKEFLDLAERELATIMSLEQAKKNRENFAYQAREKALGGHYVLDAFNAAGGGEKYEIGFDNLTDYMLTKKNKNNYPFVMAYNDGSRDYLFAQSEDAPD